MQTECAAVEEIEPHGDCSAAGREPVPGCCEHGDEYLGAMRGGEGCDQLTDKH
jgi:hypothetical protein